MTEARADPALADWGASTTVALAADPDSWPALVAAGLAAIKPAGAGAAVAVEMAVPGPATPARLDAVVTRREAGADGGAVLHQTLTLVDRTGAPVGRGRASWRTGVVLPADVADAWRRCDVGTLAWGRALGDRLGDHPGFADSASTFDGTIGLAAGDREVQLRVYRGRILEVVRKTLEGATFAVAGSDGAWTRFLLSPRDDFVRRTSEGEFNGSGSSFQYLRMFKTVVTIAVQAKRMWEGERALGSVS